MFTFYPQGTSLDSGSAFTGDHLSILGGTDANDSAWHTSTGVDPYSCDDTGFHAHWALVTGTGGFGTSLALYQSVTDLYVDIAPWNPSCAINFQVTGCNFLPLAGATVDVWTNSAKTSHVGTATTDTSGNAFIPIGTTASSLSRYYEVKKSPRFVLFSQTLTMTPGDAVPVNMHPASGYHCDGIPACADPLPETLHATHPTFGAVTLTWNGSGSLGQGWYATVNYNYPGCFCCPAKTVTVTCFLDIALGYSDNWKSN